MSVLNVGEKKNVLNFNSTTFNERKIELENIQERENKLLEKEKNSSFSRWTQYNNEHTKEMMWLALNHPKAHAILLFLVDQMDNYNAVMCSYQVLQEVMGVSAETIRKNIRILKNNGYIAILKSGTSNVYAINDSVYWKSWGNNKQYSKFPANVVLSLSEQENNYQLNLFDIGFDKHKELKMKEDM